MKALGLAFALTLLVPVSGAAAQTAADSAGIRTAVGDYIQGWYDADGPRMERSLHPSLAKRIVVRDPALRKDNVENLTAPALVEMAATNSRTPPARQRQEVTILDVFENMASVKLVADGWVDYMHLGKVDGKWVIVNVMWDEERRPRPRS